MTENVKHWIEAARDCQGNPEKAQVLPIVTIEGQYYFVDVRMTAVRNIDNIEIRSFESQSDLIRFVLKHASLIV